MIDAKNSPLVSLLLITYRQENFVEPALKSALAQTYRPLQIVVSDDCSPDKTFGVIEKIAREYRGEHRLDLHRNPKNLGVAGNLNRGWELCRGEFIVIQAGDDMSVPQRTEQLVSKWLHSEKKTGSCMFPFF